MIRAVFRLLWVAAIVGAYLGLEWALVREGGGQGLLSPGGAVNLRFVALGVAYLVARLFAFFMVPASLAYAGARLVLDGVAKRRV